MLRTVCRNICRFVLFAAMFWCSLPPASGQAPSQTRFVSPSIPPAPATFGYRAQDLLGMMAPGALVLLTAIGVVLWLQRRALAAKEIDPTGAWFGFMRGYTLALQGMWLAWMGVSLLSIGYSVWDLLPNLHLGPMAIVVEMTAFFLPLVLAHLICVAISYPVYTRVRGMEWTVLDLLKQAFWGLASALVPLTLLLAAFTALLDSQYQSALLLVAAAYLCRVIALLQLQKAAQTNPQAIAVGPLRDRLFELAEKAGVKLQQIFYLPANKGRLANAFAMVGNNVMLTDYLLQQLSRREVDAVMAHELAHLKHRHPDRLRRTLVMAISLPIAVEVVLIYLTPGRPNLFILMPVVLVLGYLVFYFVSRRFERTADREAARLTGDPEAMITGLVKITRLNQLPVQWTRRAESGLTHPSTFRRAQWLAQDAGISEERLAALLPAAEDDQERYTPPSALAGREPLFSTRYKQHTRLANFWLLALGGASPSVLTALAAGSLTGGMQWGVLLIGTALTVAIYRALRYRLALRGFHRLALGLAERLREEGVEPQGVGGRFVLLAPDMRPRLYEAFANWDIGYVFFTSDRLIYLGEQTRFSLESAQLTRAATISGPIGLERMRSIAVYWRDIGRETEGSLIFRIGDAPSLSAANRAAEDLVQQIEACKQGTAQTVSDMTPASMPPPEFGEVTSQSPGDYGRVQILINLVIYWSLAAACVGTMLGQPADGSVAVRFFPIGMACLLALFHWLPYARYREQHRPADLAR